MLLTFCHHFVPLEFKISDKLESSSSSSSESESSSDADSTKSSSEAESSQSDDSADPTYNTSSSASEDSENDVGENKKRKVKEPCSNEKVGKKRQKNPKKNGKKTWQKNSGQSYVSVGNDSPLILQNNKLSQIRRKMIYDALVASIPEGADYSSKWDISTVVIPYPCMTKAERRFMSIPEYTSISKFLNHFEKLKALDIEGKN